MIPRELGPGLAPDVGFFHGAVYVAFGTEANLQLHTFTPKGAPIDRFPYDGFFNSFPRITVPVVVYKAIEHDAATDVSVFPATAFRLDTGAVMRFPPSADGNWPCVVVDVDTVAWQTGRPCDVWLGSISTGRPTRTALHGAPDGLEAVTNGVAVCRKDIRLQDPAVGGYPSYAGDLTVGQYGYGIGVRLTGQAVRWIPGDPSDDHPDPRCATDGVNYAIVCWGNSHGVRLYLGTRAEILALPLAPTDVPVPVPPDPPDPVPPDPVPVPPDPPVPPVPVPPTPTRYPSASIHRGHMPEFLQSRGKYVGVDPARPTVVYADRSAGGAWEEVRLTRHPDDTFDAVFVAANVQLSIQPDGSLQTRPVGTDGGYELLRATTQPEGLDLLYRADAGHVLNLPLTIVQS